MTWVMVALLLVSVANSVWALVQLRGMRGDLDRMDAELTAAVKRLERPRDVSSPADREYPPSATS